MTEASEMRPGTSTYMLRPCEDYKGEYRECRRWRSRFHQYFIHGETRDCSKYMEQHRQCQLYTQSGDLKALEALTNIEVSRMRRRLWGHVHNPVWEDRSAPPSGWSDTLPPLLHDRALASSFAAAEVDAAAASEEGVASGRDADALGSADNSNQTDPLGQTDTSGQADFSVHSAQLPSVAASARQKIGSGTDESSTAPAKPSSFCNIS